MINFGQIWIFGFFAGIGWALGEPGIGIAAGSVAAFITEIWFNLQ